MEEISRGTIARDKLIAGITKAADAVGSTMGPNGNTVIIPSTTEHGEYIVTKDGVSVINSIVLSDPIENIGVKLIRQAAQKTLDEAGDGTTTATVLASSFVNNLRNFKTNEINLALNTIIPEIINKLKENSRELKREDIKFVASISANNDIQIGDIIQSAYNHSDIIKIEETEDPKDSLEFLNGMSLNVSYFSKEFINNKKKAECNFDDPNVIIINGKLESLKAFEAPIKSVAENNESLLIIAEDVNENTLRLLRTNVINGLLNVCVIKSPGFGPHRKDLLNDIALFTEATVINDMSKQYNKNILGKLKSCKIGKNNSVLVKHDEINIDLVIKELRELIGSSDLTGYDKDLIRQRLENINGKVSIIKVGGKSKIEVKERYDRYDDAVKAVACALEEGIIEGGGLALYHTVPENFENIENIICQIYRSLWSPRVMIEKNGSVYGGNMFEQNIIDPLKVTRCALENAISVAKTILSTEAIVLHESEWRNN